LQQSLALLNQAGQQYLGESNSYFNFARLAFPFTFTLAILISVGALSLCASVLQCLSCFDCFEDETLFSFTTSLVDCLALLVGRLNGPAPVTFASLISASMTNCFLFRLIFLFLHLYCESFFI
jgi:hypothetical protein